MAYWDVIRYYAHGNANIVLEDLAGRLLITRDLSVMLDNQEEVGNALALEVKRVIIYYDGYRAQFNAWNTSLKLLKSDVNVGCKQQLLVPPKPFVDGKEFPSPL